MSPQPDRHLRAVPDEPTQLIHIKTGETMDAPDVLVVKDGARIPFVEVEANFEAEYSALQHKFRAALSEITKLKRDAEAEARKHELWSEAEALHGWWALATGHPGRTFGADQFYEVLPRLKERAVGPVGVLKAICGAAFDPGTKRMKNGRLEKYDGWELLNRSREKHDSFTNRVPGEPDGNEWKHWLISHIEAQLVGKG